MRGAGSWVGLVAMALHVTLYVFVLAPLINGLGHWQGGQNFDNTADNRRLLAWEFDPSWLVRLIVVIGAWVRLS